MLVNGKIVTSGEKRRIRDGLYGVRTYDRKRCDFGYTLFSSAWSDREFLMDTNGLVVHTWKVTHSNVAELHDDGTLFTHNCGRRLEEIAPDGEVLWRWEGEEWMAVPTHHDFAWVNRDEIYGLGSIHEPVRPGMFPRGREPEKLTTDIVYRINRKKEMVWKLSFADHVEELCALAGIPFPIPYGDPYKRDRPGESSPAGSGGAPGNPSLCPSDWAHANTIEYLPDTPLGRRDPRFRRDNLLFSLRTIDIIGIIDPEKDRIVWAYGPGVLDGQHQPTMLENGNILVFDNGTYRGHSIVREIDPAAGTAVWEYSDPEEFFSPFRSGNQRLPNGNTFICECDAGRLFEVTPDGEVVWDFLNPFVGEGPHHLGKRMHRATRYSLEEAAPLLESRTDTIVSEIDREGRPIKTYTSLLESYRT